MTKIIALIILLFSFNANAGVYVEPYAGTETGEVTGKSYAGTTETKVDKDWSGSSYGLKLGYAFLDQTFGIGLDYMSGSYTGEDNVDPTLADVDYDGEDIGAFVFLDLPLFVKLQATYFFSSTFDGTEDSIGKATYEGSGYKAGISFTMIPFIGINVDFIQLNYDDVDNPTLTKIDIDRESVLVSGSLRLDF